MARMTQQEIFEILMDLHEVSNNDMMKKVYEICLKCLEDITSEITSVEDLPDIPFTNPIKKSLQMLLRTNRERDQQLKPTQTAMLPTQPKQGKRKHNIIESSTSTSSTNSQTEYGKRKVRRRRRPRRSSSSSTSSLPDPSVRNIKCKTCGLWIDAGVFREHKRNHKSPSSSSRLNMQHPERMAKNTVFQKPD